MFPPLPPFSQEVLHSLPAVHQFSPSLVKGDPPLPPSLRTEHQGGWRGIVCPGDFHMHEMVR